MRRLSPFAIVEVAMLITAEAMNALSLYVSPLEMRFAIALGIAIFGGVRLLHPRTRVGSVVYLAFSCAFCIAMSAFSAIAVFIAGLLVTRCFETFPGNRKVLAFGVAATLVVFGLAFHTGLEIEHRPAMLPGGVLIICINLLVITLIAVLNDLRSSQEALAAANAELAARAEEREEIAALGERYRIARDLHDEVGHGLTAISVQLEAAEKLGPSQAEQAGQLVSQARRGAGTTLAAIRRTVSRLRGNPLVHGDLASAIRRLAEPYTNGSSKLHVLLELESPKIDDPLIVANLERIVSEALVNASRHSRASQVTVALASNDGHFEVRIEDDGVGFDTSAARGNGLDIMRERVALVGGTCSIRSAPGHGTCVLVTVPAR